MQLTQVLFPVWTTNEFQYVFFSESDFSGSVNVDSIQHLAVHNYDIGFQTPSGSVPKAIMW